MRAARLTSSQRLQRVRNVLMDGAWHTTRAIVRKAHVMAVSACISELRQNGMVIECHRVRNLWYYQAKV